MSAPDPLHVIPLGGCGEFGLNLTCYRAGRELLAVDCGLKFPDDDQPGVDLVLPDVRFLAAHREQLGAYLLTHGHEDHIGALPYALAMAPAPVYATPYTLGLVKAKLKEHRDTPKVPLHELVPGEPVTVGCFEVEALRVTHSIPDAVALAIRSPAGLALHSGDFKFAGPGLPPSGTDEKRLAALGDEGVLLAVSDSTGALESGLAGAESELAQTLKSHFAAAPGRIIWAQFASNIERLGRVLELAHRLGRRVALEGRSLQQYAALAEHQHLLRFVPGVRASVAEAQSLPPHKVILVVTGSQGEPGSVLPRLAAGQHPGLTIWPDDTIILSARTIPGHERRVQRLLDGLSLRGATVVDGTQGERVHVSGHGHREDLRRWLALLRPQAFVPVHGRHRMLAAHAELAREAGVENVALPTNGAVLAVDDGGLRRVDEVTSGRVFVDGSRVGGVDAALLRERRALGATGVVVARVTVEVQSGALIAPPLLASVGVFVDGDDDAPLAEATAELAETLRAPSPIGQASKADLEEQVARCLRRFFRRRLGKKPVVISLIEER